jgi:RNA polymerase sigma-70 factor (ECF subfamily)
MRGLASGDVSGGATVTTATVDAPDLADLLGAEVPSLLRYARTLVRDAGQAEDLVQDTLARALERSGSFRGESGLATWLHRILHNLAVDESRKRSIDAMDVSEGVAEGAEVLWHDESYTVDAALVAERAETRRCLRDALLALPIIYRSAVVLHDAEGWTMAEIAVVQGITLPAAKQRLRRGRMMLVSALTGPRTGDASEGSALGCWEARSRVSDYMDDELPAAERTSLERHLEDCPTCPPLYAGLVAVRAAIRARR